MTVALLTVICGSVQVAFRFVEKRIEEARPKQEKEEVVVTQGCVCVWSSEVKPQL